MGVLLSKESHEEATCVFTFEHYLYKRYAAFQQCSSVSLKSILQLSSLSRDYRLFKVYPISLSSIALPDSVRFTICPFSDILWEAGDNLTTSAHTVPLSALCTSFIFQSTSCIGMKVNVIGNFNYSMKIGLL